MKKTILRMVGRSALTLYLAIMIAGLPLSVCLIASGLEPATAYSLGMLVSVVAWDELL